MKMDSKKQIWNLARSWELLVLIEQLGVQFFEHIHAGTNLEDICESFGYKKSKIRPILDLLNHEGFVDMQGDTVASSRLSDYLCSPKVHAYLRWKLDDINHWRNNLQDVLRGKSPTIHSKVGNLYEDADNLLDGVISGCSTMYPISEFVETTKAYVSGKVLDLACGSGEWGYSFARAIPDITLLSLDKYICPATKNSSAYYADINSRIKLIEQDMFSPRKLPSADTVIVTNVFMDWTDHDVKYLLQKISDDCAPNSLLIHEFLDKPDSQSLKYNVLAVLETQGRLRNKQWWKETLSIHFAETHFEKLEFGSYALCSTEPRKHYNC